MKYIKILLVIIILTIIGCDSLTGIIPINLPETNNENTTSTGLKEIDFSTVEASSKGNITNFGQFLSVGYPVMNNSEGLIQISEDGLSWKTLYKCKEMELMDVVYAYGKIVAVGTGGIIYTNDSENWNFVQDAINFDAAADYDHTLSALSGIVYGDGIFVAVGTASRIVYSKDGENWVHSTIDNIDSDLTYGQTHLRNVNYINGKFYITGNMNRVITLRKDDKKGLILENNTSLGQVTSVTTDIEYGNGIYFLVGTTNDYYSKDGVNWNELDNWTQVYNLIYENGKFYGASGYGEVVSSVDGTSWEVLLKISRTTFFDIIYANNIFVTAGRMGAIYVSKDGKEWKSVDTGESNTVNSIIYID